jgi:hypothetical protein
MSFIFLSDRASLGSAAALLATIALAGCSSPGGNTTNMVERDASVTEAVTMNETVTLAPETPGNVEGGTIGGDGSEVVLSSLSAGDLETAKLEGELGCSFTTAISDAPLLIAKGNVGSKESAWGVVKVGDYVEQVSAGGGFNAMVRGVTFAGKGKSIRIAPTGEKASGGGESPPVPATLTYDRMDGAKREIEGFWTCGP